MKSVVTAAACMLACFAVLSPAAGESINKCVGPGGDVKLTNQECPEGYALESSSAASTPSSSGETETQPQQLQPPRAPSPAGETGPELCSGGSFEYREGGIYFVSDTRGACAGVIAVCTFEVRVSSRVVTDDGGIRGDRREEGYATTTEQRILQFDYREKIGKFGTARIGDVDLPGKVTGWNCRHER